MPAGTVTGAPFTKTSRCACTCRKTNSCVSGVSPARTVSFIGSAGAGHGAAPLAGVGEGVGGGGGGGVCVVVCWGGPPPPPGGGRGGGGKKRGRSASSAAPYP